MLARRRAASPHRLAKPPHFEVTAVGLRLRDR